MIEIYTDGSYKLDSSDTSEEICAGVGMVVRFIDSSTNDLVKEEYYSFKYTNASLSLKINDDDGLFSCFDTPSSTLIECLGFSEGVNAFRFILNEFPLERCILHVDDIFICKMFQLYKDLTISGEDLYSNEHYGCYMCTLDKIFNGDIDFLNRITIVHVEAHKDNDFNNQADYLAAYGSDSAKRMLNTLVKYSDLKRIPNKKTYFLTLTNFLEIK